MCLVLMKTVNVKQIIILPDFTRNQKLIYSHFGSDNISSCGFTAFYHSHHHSTPATS